MTIEFEKSLTMKVDGKVRTVKYSPKIALQLAAFAVGRKLEFRTLPDEPEFFAAYDVDKNLRWNPLDDKGDAFSLAIQLKMIVRAGQVQCHNPEIWEISPDLGNSEYETQLAITRTAALTGLHRLTNAQYEALCIRDN